jgi:hypothetical protein
MSLKNEAWLFRYDVPDARCAVAASAADHQSVARERAVSDLVSVSAELMPPLAGTEAPETYLTVEPAGSDDLRIRRYRAGGERDIVPHEDAKQRLMVIRKGPVVFDPRVLRIQRTSVPPDHLFEARVAL